MFRLGWSDTGIVEPRFFDVLSMQRYNIVTTFSPRRIRTNTRIKSNNLKTDELMSSCDRKKVHNIINSMSFDGGGVVRTGGRVRPTPLRTHI